MEGSCLDPKSGGAAPCPGSPLFWGRRVWKSVPGLGEQGPATRDTQVPAACRVSLGRWPSLSDPVGWGQEESRSPALLPREAEQSAGHVRSPWDPSVNSCPGAVLGSHSGALRAVIPACGAQIPPWGQGPSSGQGPPSQPHPRGPAPGSLTPYPPATRGALGLLR